MTSTSRTSNFGDYRIISKAGAVVAFEPAKVAAAMTKAFLAVSAPSRTRHNRISFHLKTTKQNAQAPLSAESACDSSQASAETGTQDSGGNGGGGSGGGGSDDTGGDGDGDGPRRRRKSTKSLPPKSRRAPVAARSRPPHRDLDTAHTRALITLILLTLFLLASALVFALAGHSLLASEAMGMAMGLPKLAKCLVKPK